MKEKILKSKTHFIVTFAAIALMGFGLLQATVPTSADDGTQHPHFLGKPFRSNLFNGQHMQMSERARSRHHRSEVIAGFLGISKDELKTRVESGDSIHQIVAEKGKTRADFHAYILDYMKQHKLRDGA